MFYTVIAPPEPRMLTGAHRDQLKPWPVIGRNRQHVHTGCLYKEDGPAARSHNPRHTRQGQAEDYVALFFFYVFFDIIVFEY